MYIIGLIDDEPSQLVKIRRTIKSNAPKDVEFDFVAYPLADKSNLLVEQAFQSVMQDILNQKIACLIIDYKIMVKTTKVKGTDIFGRIKDVVPKFPIIMLTDVVEESIEPIFIDADKVYKKKEFFKLEEEYSKEKVTNIFDSMIKYVTKRDELQLTLQDLKQKMVQGKTIGENIGELLRIESELDEFYPMEQTQIDKVFDTNKAKEIVELIEKANSMLE